MKQASVYIKMTLVSLAMLFSTVIYGQYALPPSSGSWGNTAIFQHGEEVIFHINHDFLSGSGGVLPGIILTARSTEGYFSFTEGAGWSGASDAAYVDGYVRDYNSGKFVFPIGGGKIGWGKYRPAAVSTADPAAPASAAYFAVDPNNANNIPNELTGDAGVLPKNNNGPFPTDPTHVDGASLQVSTTNGYWDISGATPARISLSWDSDLPSTIKSISNLTIVGWNPATQKWEKIPSTVDTTPIDTVNFGKTSTLTKGSITSDAAFAPDKYTVYTLAGTALGVFVQKSVDNMYPTVGDNVTFTISVTNGLPNDATNVTVTEQLPAGYTYVSSHVTAGSYNPSTGIWSVGTLHSNDYATLTLVAAVNDSSKPVPAGYYSNVAVAKSDETPADSSNVVTPIVTPRPVTQAFEVTKSSGTVQDLGWGKYVWQYTIDIHSLLNKDTLRHVGLTDDLIGKTFVDGETFEITGGPTGTGTLFGNGKFNGASDIQLLDTAKSYLLPNAKESVTFTVTVTSNGFTGDINNFAVGTGDYVWYDARGIGTKVSDTETSNIAVTTIPNTDVQIAKGLSPNGDGMNDTWTIIHPNTMRMDVQIFNRWGNVVYEKNNYQNDWDGTGNKGTLLGKQLPDGTYYYIVTGTSVVVGNSGEILYKGAGYLTLKRK